MSRQTIIRPRPRALGSDPLSDFDGQLPKVAKLPDIDELSLRAIKTLESRTGASGLTLGLIRNFVSENADWFRSLVLARNCGCTTAIEIKGFVEKMDGKHDKPLSDWCKDFVKNIVDLRDNTFDTWEGIGSKSGIRGYDASKLYLTSKLQKNPKFNLRDTTRAALVYLVIEVNPDLPLTADGLKIAIASNPNWKESLRKNGHGKKVIQLAEDFMIENNI